VRNKQTNKQNCLLQVANFLCPSNNERINLKKCNILGIQNGVDEEVCLLGGDAARLAVNTDTDWGDGS